MAPQRPLYHRFAWAFDLVVPDASAARVRRLAALLGAYGVRPPARILDAGCGTGNYARPGAARLPRRRRGPLDEAARRRARQERGRRTRVRTRRSHDVSPGGAVCRRALPRRAERRAGRPRARRRLRDPGARARARRRAAARRPRLAPDGSAQAARARDRADGPDAEGPPLLPLGHAARSHAPAAAAARGDPAHVAAAEHRRAERIRHALLDLDGAAGAAATRGVHARPPGAARARRAAGRSAVRGGGQRPWNGGGVFLLAKAVTPALKSSVRPEFAMACASSSICVSRLSHVDWWNRRLAAPKAFDGPCASSRASASTAPLNSASGTTRVTRPHSSASRAVSTRLVK